MNPLDVHLVSPEFPGTDTTRRVPGAGGELTLRAASRAINFHGNGDMGMISVSWLLKITGSGDAA